MWTDFEKPELSQWRSLVERDLKGQDFDDILAWSTPDGLEGHPLYTQGPQPQPVVTRGDWKIRQDYHPSLEGVDQVRLRQDHDLSRLLQGQECVLYGPGVERKLAGILAGEMPFEGRVSWDPVAEEADFDQVAKLLERAQSLPELKLFCSSGWSFHQGGATAAQELGWTLASVIYLLRQLTSRQVDAAEVVSRLEVELAVSSDLFLEMAKLRAARLCLGQIFAAFSHSGDCDLHARQSLQQHCLLDAGNNLLRASVAGFAAVCAGADSLQLAAFAEDDPDGLRLACTQQLLMRHEAGLGRVADPGAGSYYLETLTHQLGQRAWEIMAGVEARGGLPAYADTIAETLRHQRESRLKSVARGRTILVGTNWFADPNEWLASATRPSPGGPYSPLFEGEPFEKFRCEPGPKCLILTVGRGLAQARAAFASSFLAAGSFPLESPLPADTTSQARRLLEASFATLVVLCADDERLPELIEQLAFQDKVLAVAAPPQPLAGVDFFLHRKADHLDLLTKLREACRETT
ncbi:MAG: methylmalonyl-CoA mutase family protein [Vulcanimicrobiota bacterium]